MLSDDFPIWASKNGGNGMMMNPYPHPQHRKVVNHFVYVWSGYESHFMQVMSLNHCTKASVSVSSDTAFS
jgi:hypothetical protein